MRGRVAVAIAAELFAIVAAPAVARIRSRRQPLPSQ
jgi:hypothetical protein